jgi:hypothetical protein
MIQKCRLQSNKLYQKQRTGETFSGKKFDNYAIRKFLDVQIRDMKPF